MDETEKQLRELLRESRRITRESPGGRAAFDQLDAEANDKGSSATRYLDGVRDVVRKFKR